MAPGFRRREFLTALGIRNADAQRRSAREPVPPEPMPPEPSMYWAGWGLYGLAALVWLGLELWGIFGDCRPRDVDGQCGMGEAFAMLIGTAIALVILAVGIAADIVSGYFNPDRRRIWVAGAMALFAAIAALLLDVVVGSVLAGTPVGQALGYLLVWPVVAIPGAPAAFTVVYLVATDRLLLERRSAHQSVARACGVGAGAGVLLGVIVGQHWAYTASGRAWMVLGGAWAGAVAAYVFWRGGEEQPD